MLIFMPLLQIGTSMKPSLFYGAALMALAACSAPLVVTQAPTPVSAPTAEPTTVPRAVVDTPPSNWQLLDEANDQLPGISVLRAQRELLAGLQPKQTVLVAVIDGGLDTTQVDLLPHLCRTSGATPRKFRAMAWMTTTMDTWTTSGAGTSLAALTAETSITKRWNSRGCIRGVITLRR